MDLKYIHITAFLLVLYFLCFIVDVKAQDFEKVLSGTMTGSFDIFDQDHEDIYDDEYKDREKTKAKVYIYEEVTIPILSKLYWAIGFLDIENDTYIDNYMKINECDMYKSYAAAEFDWNQIRAATRKFIENNKSDFPTRLQFVQPLMLMEYDVKRKAFYVNPEYQYKSTRRFEVMAKDGAVQYCTDNAAYAHVGYTKGIMLELSRPFSLEFLTVDQSVAENYVLGVTKKFKKLRPEYQSKTNFESLRQAYIVFKVKVFAHGKLVAGSGTDQLTQVLGALEGYDVYSDMGLKNLLFSKSYVIKSDSNKQNARLLKEFDILRDRSRNGGVLTNVN